MTMQTVFVSGGASGLGLAAATHFHSVGWHVLIADIDRTAVERAAKSMSDKVIGLQVDVTDGEALREAFVSLPDGCDRINALVTCAGITRVGAAADLAATDWRRVIDIDLTGTFLTCQAAFPYMPPGAAVVTVASIAGLRPMPGRAAYCAAKAGVISLTQVLAAEWAAAGIRVNCVAPSWVDTPFLRAAAARGDVNLDDLVTQPPLGGFATANDVVGAIAYLASPDARFVTGQTIAVDGGWTFAR